jgi:hypothetical protein
VANLPRYPESKGATGNDADAGTDRGSPPGTPRWVKASGIIGLVVVLLIVIALVTGLGGPGAHGPGRHLSGAGLAGQTAPPSATDQAMHQP